MSIGTQQRVGLELFERGVCDLVCVLPPDAEIAPGSSIPAAARGKAPGMRRADGTWSGYNWRSDAPSAADVERWYAAGANIGLKADRFPALDIDVLDAQLAARIERLAVETFGHAPVRVGRAPKRLLVFRLADGVDPFGKLQLVLRSPSGDRHLVEFLARGSQYVVDGVHPTTGRPYEWRDGTGALAPATLPGITGATAAAFLDRVGELLAAEGFGIFASWASRWDGGNDAAIVQRDWQSLTPPFRLGWDWIVQHARGHGFNDAALDFDVDDPTPLAPATDDPRPLLPAGASDIERIAALTGDASRAFALALPDLLARDVVGDPLLDEYGRLRTAAQSRDHLDRGFRGCVLRETTRVGTTIDDVGRFCTVLGARLERDAWWSQRTRPERDLLARAGFAFIARRDALSVLLGASPGEPVGAPTGESDELLEGFIPRRGLAMIVAPPGSGKSFVALDLAARITRTDPLTGDADGERFVGRRVRHGAVLYFASEDTAGLAKRRAAWMDTHGAVPHLHVFPSVPPLGELDRAVTFVRTAMERIRTGDTPPLALIVIDVARAAIAGEENSSDVVGAAMNNASLLARMFDAAVLLVHHAGRGDGARARGSSAFDAAQDCIVAIEKSGDTVKAKITKNKNGPGGQTFAWELRGSVLHPVATTAAAAASVPKQDAHARAVALAVREIATETTGVTRADLRDAAIALAPEFFDATQGNPSTARSYLSRAVRRAIDLGWVREVGNRRTPRYAVGPADVPVETPDVGDLEAVLA